MGGPNLELFRFAFYVFFPVAMLVHYGDPTWYSKNVLPFRDRVIPPPERTNQNFPSDHSELQQELTRIKVEKLARRAERENADGVTVHNKRLV